MAAPAGQGTFQERWNTERRQRYAVRRELMRGIETRCAHAMLRRLDEDTASLDAHDTAAAHIACQTAITVGYLWDCKRPLWRGETCAFRTLGGLAARVGLSDSQVLDAMRSGVKEAVASARVDLENGPAPWRTRLAVLDHSEGRGAHGGRRHRQGAASGDAGPAAPRRGQGGRPAGILAGGLRDDELGAAASRVGLGASREHGVVLLLHTGAAPAPTEAAAHDVEALIPEAVDLGPTVTQPVGRCVVFPVLTHGRCIEARTILHDIATRHGVLAIAPIAAPRLGALAETYREVTAHLARVVQGCGYTSGIIDPACVGRACPAEGMSPPPSEAWTVEAMTAAVA